MKSQWNDKKAENFRHWELAMRVYSANLLGSNPNLVLSGGGNTSLKTEQTDIFGKKRQVLYVKGSGCDMATMTERDFALLDLKHLQKLAALDRLDDEDMVQEQHRASLEPKGPEPSLETLLHAIIPYKYVDHVHADAIVTISNTPGAEQTLKELYENKVLILPYVKPGFELARQVYQALLTHQLDHYQGIILIGHGLFTFSDEAKVSYENTIGLVNRAIHYLKCQNAWEVPESNVPPAFPPLEIARMRKLLSELNGRPMLVRWHFDKQTVAFSHRDNLTELSSRGLLTPDHVIRIKPFPMVINGCIEQALEQFAYDYHQYFECYCNTDHIQLDGAPRMAIAKNNGAFAIGANTEQLKLNSQIMLHLLKAIQRAEILGGWRPTGLKHLFDMEYWSLEQAKLKRQKNREPFEGKVVMVTGAGSGIGKACANRFMALGACVVGLDLNGEIEGQFDSPNYLGITCDVTDSQSILSAVACTAEHFGGIDLLVSNAGMFPASAALEAIDETIWNNSIEVNLSSHMKVIKHVTPYLKQGIEPAIVVVASKNVPAPGPGAAAYSAAKAGLTQIARVAALELAQYGIRVNTIHPNAVFDTELWSDEMIAARAASYGLTVEHYKQNNLLQTEISSKHVAELVIALCDKAFAKTTGAQIPIDGGNERVI